MGRRLLLDTNILLDALVEGRPGCEDARCLLRICNGGGDMGIVSSHSLKDVYYLLGKGRPESYTRQAVRQLMNLVVIGPISAQECEMAVLSDEPDFEDGLVRACAELNDVDFIVTRDKRAFALSPVKSVTPEEYLQIHAQDERQLKASLGVH